MSHSSSAHQASTPSTRVDGASPPAALSSRPVLLVGSLARQLAGSHVLADEAESLPASFLSVSQHVYNLIVVSAAGEPQLASEIASLRKAAPASRIVLIGEPVDERACRRALASGADDYEIWPVTLDKMIRAASVVSVPAVSMPAVVPVDPVVISVLQMPVQYDIAMMDDLLADKASLAAHAVAILQSVVDWPGTLRYDMGEQTPDPEHPSVVVASNGVVFGRLVLAAAVSSDDKILGLLNQSAAWLSGWLDIARRQEQLRTLAITDELSGAYNRRYFTRFVTSLLDKARIERFRVSILLFDIDNFKHYNDTFGHTAGDAIIRELIGLLKRCTRQQDLVARLGGDEFAVVFWDHDAPRQPNSQHPTSVKAATERFRKAVSECEWGKCAHIKGTVSISGGIATFPWDGDTLESLLEKADQTLLRAKSQGKNVILLSESKENNNTDS